MLLNPLNYLIDLIRHDSNVAREAKHINLDARHFLSIELQLVSSNLWSVEFRNWKTILDY